MSDGDDEDDRYMQLALAEATRARHRAAPNPWVGAVVVQVDGTVAGGATQSFGGAHAEVAALASSNDPRGATVYSTLEPCNHRGRTGPCTEALVEAEVARVVVAIEDPDPNVAGTGLARLREAGIEVSVGARAEEATRQLRPYLHHRRTGRPWVLLKLAATLDGRVAAPDGTARWITGAEARADSHRLRAESDAILVGAGTVRTDDPSLTVRDWPGPGSGVAPSEISDPRRIVLGTAPADARIQPCLEHRGDIGPLLDRLGSEGVVQLMVEGGPRVAHSFHAGGFVDHYVLYLAPVLFGGNDAMSLFAGPGAATVAGLWRGHFEDVTRLGRDLRIDLAPGGATDADR